MAGNGSPHCKQRPDRQLRLVPSGSRGPHRRLYDVSAQTLPLRSRHLPRVSCLGPAFCSRLHPEEAVFPLANGQMSRIREGRGCRRDPPADQSATAKVLIQTCRGILRSRARNRTGTANSKVQREIPILVSGLAPGRETTDNAATQMVRGEDLIPSLSDE